MKKLNEGVNEKKCKWKLPWTNLNNHSSIFNVFINKQLSFSKGARILSTFHIKQVVLFISL